MQKLWDISPVAAGTDYTEKHNNVASIVYRSYVLSTILSTVKTGG